MAETRFTCDECGQKLKVDSARAGSTVECPKCNARLVVPEAASAAAAEFSPPAASPPQPAAVSSSAPRAGMPTLSLSDLRDPREGTAKTVLVIFALPVWLVLAAFIVLSMGIPLIYVGLFALIGYLTRLFMLAYVKINAVKTSPTQFPEIYAVATDACQRLRIEQPDVYVLQDSVWNAFAAKLAGKRIVVLLSGAVDAILLKGDMAQVSWIVGHEIGHHAAGHFGIGHILICMGGWIPQLLLWYRRRGELTCDRIGLYAAGSSRAAIGAMANMTVGAQLADQLNIEDAIKQWNDHRREFFVRYRVMYSGHPPHLARLEEIIKSAQELGIPA